MMEHNDQVQDEPLAGNSGEIQMDSSKEKNSATKPSEKKEENVPETTEVTETSSGDKDITGPLPSEPESTITTESLVEPESTITTESVVEPESTITTESVVEPESPAIPESTVPPEAIVSAKPAKKKKPSDKVESSEDKPPADKPKPKRKKKPAGDPEKNEPETEAELLTEAGSGEISASPEPAPSFVQDFDYSALTRDDLVNRLEALLGNQDVQEIRSDIDHIKVNFYKKNKAEIEQKRKRFIEEGGNIEDFQAQPDNLEEKIKILFMQYRDLKTDFNKNQELEKHDNLKRKYEVIEKIKELINTKESINRTFNEFRDLQTEWRLIGLVPQAKLKDLWDTYNHHVEKFYDFIKINKELRDLDLKKNMELKMQLCERAEELLMESSMAEAFKSLQKYHDRWREIGPVPLEARNDLWERFKEATAKINRNHQQYFEDLKKTQKKNLVQKELICEQAEEISNQVLDSHRQWDEKSKELIELQKVWKSIGFAPKKENNKVYERFRRACDVFFTRKREFYAQNKETQLDNLQRKTDLCIQAESLKESTEWKETSADLINLQKKWKEVGPGPKKQSDATWNRFRAACDYFFKKKSEYFKNIDKTHTQNLELKKTVLKEVESLKLSEDIEENFKTLNEFQRKWSEIGFVPFKEKEILQEQFRKAINTHFDNLDVNDSRRDMLKFRNKLSNMVQKPKSDAKLGQERDRYLNRLQQLKSDIVLWENNIGFFAKSKNAESMIRDVQSKIDDAKENIKLLEQKVEMIDSLDSD